MITCVELFIEKFPCGTVHLGRSPSLGSAMEDLPGPSSAASDAPRRVRRALEPCASAGIGSILPRPRRPFRLAHVQPSRTPVPSLQGRAARAGNTSPIPKTPTKRCVADALEAPRLVLIYTLEEAQPVAATPALDPDEEHPHARTLAGKTASHGKEAREALCVRRPSPAPHALSPTLMELTCALVMRYRTSETHTGTYADKPFRSNDQRYYGGVTWASKQGPTHVRTAAGRVPGLRVIGRRHCVALAASSEANGKHLRASNHRPSPEPASALTV